MKTTSNNKVKIITEKLSVRGLSSQPNSEAINSDSDRVGEVTEYDDTELPLWKMMQKLGVA